MGGERYCPHQGFAFGYVCLSGYLKVRENVTFCFALKMILQQAHCRYRK